jgi:hypothetical protein
MPVVTEGGHHWYPAIMAGFVKPVFLFPIAVK